MMDGIREGELQRIIREARIVTFLLARVDEMESAEAETCRRAVDSCCDWIDCSPFGTLPGTNMVRGAVQRFEPLKELACHWADHPDYRPEWSTQ